MVAKIRLPQILLLTRKPKLRQQTKNLLAKKNSPLAKIRVPVRNLPIKVETEKLST